MRVLILEHALPSNERTDISEQEINPLARFKSARGKWLVEGEPTPFNYIHKLLNYGRAASKDMKTRSRVRWSADNKRLYFDGQGLEIERWRQFVHDLLARAEEIMVRQLLFGDQGGLPAMDLRDMIDNPNRREAGYYFALEKADAVNKSRQRMLMRLKRSGMWDRMIVSSGRKYGKDIADNRRCCVCCTGGCG